MEISAYCKCNETLTWYQVIDGQNIDITSQFTQLSNTTWAFQPDISQLGEIQVIYCCDDVCVLPATYTITSEQEPSYGISLIKTPNTINIANAQVGDTIFYNFTVTNTGAFPLTNITINDSLFAVSGSIASLAAGSTDSTTLSGTYSITQADIDAGFVLNSAVATGITPDGPISDSDTANVTVSGPPDTPSVAITKTASPSAITGASVGDIITYNFLVSNTGNIGLTNVVVTDPLITISGAPINLGVGGSNSSNFTGTYSITQADIDAGNFLNTASVTADSTSGQVLDTDSINVPLNTENRAMGLDSPAAITVNEDGTLDLSGFTCLDGTPIDEWEVSFDNGTTWLAGFGPGTIGDIAWDCSKWRFRCDNDWSDADVLIDVVSGSDTYQDATIQIDEGNQGFYSICKPCGTGNQVWEYRIDDAEADEDHALTPNIVVGDRPNSDPGLPSPDQQWQRMDYAYTCNDCIFFNIDEIWKDNVDPDPSGSQLGEFFCFYVRTSCDGGSNWEPEIKIRMET